MRSKDISNYKCVVYLSWILHQEYTQFQLHQKWRWILMRICEEHTNAVRISFAHGAKSRIFYQKTTIPILCHLQGHHWPFSRMHPFIYHKTTSKFLGNVIFDRLKLLHHLRDIFLEIAHTFSDSHCLKYGRQVIFLLDAEECPYIIFTRTVFQRLTCSS